MANVIPFQMATVEARMHVWKLDRPGATLMHRVGTGVAGADSPTGTGPLGAHRGDATEPAQLDVPSVPHGHLSGASPGLVLVNQAVAYDHRRWDYGSTIAVTLTGPYSICHWIRGQSEPESQFGEASA